MYYEYLFEQLIIYNIYLCTYTHTQTNTHSYIIQEKQQDFPGYIFPHIHLRE